MTDKAAGGRKWRLHWSAPSTEQAGVSADADGVTTLWVGSEDPQALKAFVAAQRWSEEEIIELSVELSRDGRSPRSSVTCRPTHIDRWDPDMAPLPACDPQAQPPRSRSHGRLALLQAMRRGVDEAVAAGALNPEDGAGLMLLAQDALDRARQRRDRDG